MAYAVYRNLLAFSGYRVRMSKMFIFCPWLFFSAGMNPKASARRDSMRRDSLGLATDWANPLGKVSPLGAITSTQNSEFPVCFWTINKYPRENRPLDVV